MTWRTGTTSIAPLPSPAIIRRCRRDGASAKACSAASVLSSRTSASCPSSPRPTMYKSGFPVCDTLKPVFFAFGIICLFWPNGDAYFSLHQSKRASNLFLLGRHAVSSSWRHCGASRSRRGVLWTPLDPALSVAYNAEAWQHALPTTPKHTPSPHGASHQKKKNLALAPWPQLALVGEKDFLSRTRPTALYAIQRNLNSSYHNLSSPRRPPAANAARPKDTKRACLCHRQHRLLHRPRLGCIDIPRVCIRTPNANPLDDIRRRVDMR